MQFEKLAAHTAQDATIPLLLGGNRRYSLAGGMGDQQAVSWSRNRYGASWAGSGRDQQPVSALSIHQSLSPGSFQGRGQTPHITQEQGSGCHI